MLSLTPETTTTLVTSPHISEIGLAALFHACARARESKERNPIIIDPYAEILAGDYGNEAFERMISVMPAAQLATCARTAYFDNFVLQSVNTWNIEQVVNLGCGMDTRAYRLIFPEHIRIFEIDLPKILFYKEFVLKRFKDTPTCARRVIPADLGALDSRWMIQLLQNGFQRNKPAVWVLEGLTMHLSEWEVYNLFDGIRRLSTIDSRIILCVWKNDFITSSDTLYRYVRELFEKFKSPLKFGVDNPRDILMRLGFGRDIWITSFWDIFQRMNLEHRVTDAISQEQLKSQFVITAQL